MLEIRLVAIIANGVILELPEDPGIREDSVDLWWELTKYIGSLPNIYKGVAHKWSTEEFQQVGIDPAPMFQKRMNARLPPPRLACQRGGYNASGRRYKQGRFNYLFTSEERGLR